MVVSLPFDVSIFVFYKVNSKTTDLLWNKWKLLNYLTLIWSVDRPAPESQPVCYQRLFPVIPERRWRSSHEPRPASPTCRPTTCSAAFQSISSPRPRRSEPRRFKNNERSNRWRNPFLTSCDGPASAAMGPLRLRWTRFGCDGPASAAMDPLQLFPSVNHTNGTKTETVLESNWSWWSKLL